MSALLQAVTAMLTAILVTLVLGCAERTDLAPVWSGYQNLNEKSPPEAFAMKEHGPSAPKRQVPRPVPADRHSPPAKTKARSPKRQASVPAVNPAIRMRSVKSESKANPGMVASASADTKKIKPESGDVKPVRKKPAATKSTAASSTERGNIQLRFGWPLTGSLLKNYAQTGRKGIKIAGKKGQAVRAAEDGKVVYSGQGLIGYGNLLIIKHNDLYLTAYANNSALLAKEGDVVKKGQEIATVGVGTSHKAMLHFEIRKQGKSVNPLTLLPKL